MEIDDYDYLKVQHTFFQPCSCVIVFLSINLVKCHAFSAITHHTLYRLYGKIMFTLYIVYMYMYM